jgi:signal transduction histidine kinase
MSHAGPIAVNARYYLVALGVAVAAALLQWALQPWVGSRVPFLFFLPALVFATTRLGRGPALPVLLAGAVNAVLLAPPVGRFRIDTPGDVVATVAYVLVGLIVVHYGGRQRLTTARAALAEERLALAQTDTGVGVFELDFSRGTAFLSSSLCRILGQPVSSGPVSLERWFGSLHPEHVESSKRSMQEHLAQGVTEYEREQFVELPCGSKKWLLHRVRLETDAAGVLTRARGATVDITARKETDELLQRTRAELQQQVRDLERLHAFSQQIVAAGEDLGAALRGLLSLLIELHGAEHGVVSLCATRESSGMSIAAEGRMNGAPPVDAGDDYEVIVAKHREWAQGQGLCWSHSIALTSAESAVMGAITIVFRAPHVQTKREIRLCEVCATTAAAVVERERARVSAADNERRFSVALEASAVPFTILLPVRDSSGAIVDFHWSYLNAAAARALGRDAADLVDRRIGVQFPRAWDPPKLFEHYVSVVERREQCEFEVRSTATGNGGWFQVIAAPLGGSVAVWFMNITDRKRHEQAMHEADRRKDEFLAMIAHELRNPLAPIRQGVSIAGMPASSESQRRWAHGIIERQVKNMALLLDELLDVSRIGRGTLTLNKSIEPLAGLVEAAIEIARPQIDSRRHQLSVSLPAAPVSLEVDRLRMTQVLSNLLTNAAKYTDPGGRIQLVATVGAGGVRVQVLDDGIGLDADQLEQIFEMFAQIPTAIDKSQGGLGVGLALARSLVQLHGGSIRAASEGPRKGAEFTIELPPTCVVADTGADYEAEAAHAIKAGAAAPG